MDEHAEHVSAAIAKLTEVNLLLNPNRCHFAQQSIHLLGFCISAKGIFLDPRKVSNVQEWPTPKTGKDIMSFLGVVNYFREHIPAAARLTAPLDALRNIKEIGKLWTPACQKSFDQLKYVISRALVLSFPDLTQPFYVATDASNYGIGAVLYQKSNDKIKYIRFMARALSKSERNYSVTCRELLAIVFALHKFHQYLWGQKFTLYTDHRALTYLRTQKYANAMMINWFQYGD